MARLPIPGSDQGQWGEILNDYLSVAHQTDGTLKDITLPPNSVTPVMLTQAYVPVSQKGAAQGVATLDIDGKVPSSQLPSEAAPSDATTGSKGIIQLAGDLAGTAAAPTVPALANKAATTTTIIAGTGLTGGGDLSSNRTLAVDFGISAGTAAQGNDSRIAGAEQTSNKGAANGYASLDGGGKVPSAQLPAAADATVSTKGILQLAGDLAGTAATPTVPALANKVATTTTIGAGTGLTGGGDLTTNRTLAVNFGAAAGTVAQGNDSRITGAEQTTNKGANNGYASLDGTGKVPSAQLPATADATTGSKGIIQLAGDLAGTAAAPTVPALAGKVATTTTITAGTGLTGGGDLSANRTLAVSYGVIAGTAAQGNDSRITGAEQTSSKGVANGYAGLDSGGKVPSSQLTAISQVHPFSSGGPLITEVGSHRLYNDTSAAWTILSVRASVGTAPTGSSLIVDVNVNGTTIFTTQGNRPTIAIAGNTSGRITNMNITTVAAGSYLTIDIDQVGSTTSGSNLVVQIEVI
jgi:hypothetical protein